MLTQLGLTYLWFGHVFYVKNWFSFFRTGFRMTVLGESACVFMQVPKGINIVQWAWVYVKL